MVRVKHFLSVFAKNGQSNLVLVLVLVIESKGPCCSRVKAGPSLFDIVPAFALSNRRRILITKINCLQHNTNMLIRAKYRLCYADEA